MKNVIKVVSLLILTLCSGCVNYIDSAAEMNKLELKTAKLEYLKKLYDVREDVSFKKKIKELGSMILEEQLSIDNEN